MNPQLAQLVDRAIQLPRELPYTVSVYISPDYVDAVIFKKTPTVDEPFEVSAVEEFHGLHNNEVELTAALAAVESVLRGDYDREVESLASLWRE
ncbi:hypothetical protein [Paenibacillus sp. SYP-B4298]|uniref:hypothetical protein n=1 Tax=Paenibacillus sp. SYP-B4298 TaxID=2996034 RepID=UPI0022DDE4F9|nr:hypothetical protein [Paenibacillus sp. SYP-B4298]